MMYEMNSEILPLIWTWGVYFIGGAVQDSVAMDDEDGIHSGFPESYCVELFLCCSVFCKIFFLNFSTYKMSFHCKMNINVIA